MRSREASSRFALSTVIGVELTGSLAAGAYLAVAIELQNGAPDGLALLRGATLLDALSYEGAITAATIGGQSYNLVEGTVLPATVARSYRRRRSRSGGG